MSFTFVLIHAGMLTRVPRLDSEENLLNFQKGKLQDKDQEWHKLVPDEARDALGKEEVQRQSVIFEVIKSEADYVADLAAVQAVRVKSSKASCATHAGFI